MAHNPQISELQAAIGEHYVGKTNASGIQEYKRMDPDFFLHAADIKVKRQAFINDEEAANKPGVHASPLNPPSDPALNATLQEVFDDYFVYWTWNGATWVKVTEDHRLVNLKVTYTNFIETMDIMPRHMNGWRLKELTAYNGSAIGNFAAIQVITINGVVAGPNVTLAPGGKNSFVDGATLIAQHSHIGVNVAAIPTPADNYVFMLVMQKP